MGTKLTWKRKNESDQVISHCGRYWISLPDQFTSGCNLWHDDTGVKINTFVTPALAKVAAQHHLDNLHSAWQVMLDGIQPLRRDDRVEDDERQKPGVSSFADLVEDTPGLSLYYIGNDNDRKYYINVPASGRAALWSCHLSNLSRTEYSKASRAVKAYRLGLEHSDRMAKLEGK